MFDRTFSRYTEFDPLVPVWCVTPDVDGCIHRFFDTSPFSPSGRYLAVTRFLQEEKLPSPGEVAEIILVDLETGEQRLVSRTYGWESQLGANINWGPDDETLYFNNVDLTSWEPFIVRLNPHTREQEKLEGFIYRISPDSKKIISACPKRMRRTQDGYGVVIPDEKVPRNFGLSDEDGLYITDTETGKQELLISIEEIFEKAKPKINKSYYEQGDCYGFHCKYNPQGDRILFSMRWMRRSEESPWNKIRDYLEYFVVTMKPDGSDVHVAVGPEEWAKGGHHINWFPDEEKLSMNLSIDGDQQMYLVQVDADGNNLKKIIDNVPGSGHPTIHPNGKQVLTDAYVHEKVSRGDGTIPLRWIDLEEETEKTLVTINVSNQATEKSVAMRIDPHPAWDPTHRFVAFNGFYNGTRRVFVADLRQVIKP